MDKLDVARQKKLDNEEPWTQNQRLGARLMEEGQYGLVCFELYQPAGTTGVVTALTPGDLAVQGANGVTQGGPPDPDLIFDFEVIDVIVRTETSVASSAVTGKAGVNAFSDAIVSAVANAITRMGQNIIPYNKFYPRSNAAGYALAPLTFTDSGGATAAARSITVIARRL